MEGKIMKAVQVTEWGKVELKDVPVPLLLKI